MQKTYRRLFGMIFLGPVFGCKHQRRNRMRKPTMANGQNKVVFSESPPPFLGIIRIGSERTSRTDGIGKALTRVSAKKRLQYVDRQRTFSEALDCVVKFPTW